MVNSTSAWKMEAPVSYHSLMVTEPGKNKERPTEWNIQKIMKLRGQGSGGYLVVLFSGLPEVETRWATMDLNKPELNRIKRHSTRHSTNLNMDKLKVPLIRYANQSEIDVMKLKATQN